MNERRRRFCELYAEGRSAAEAARLAGYSPRTAKSQAQRLLTFVDVQAYLGELQQRATDASIATGREVRACLTGILRDDAQGATARIKAGATLLRYSPPEEGLTPAPASDDVQGAEDAGSTRLILPWRPWDHMQPTHYLDDDGELQPLEPSDICFYFSESQAAAWADYYSEKEDIKRDD